MKREIDREMARTIVLRERNWDRDRTAARVAARRDRWRARIGAGTDAAGAGEGQEGVERQGRAGKEQKGR